ncbi:DUF3631 domain-containing protein [Streptosporangium lutulentum]
MRQLAEDLSLWLRADLATLEQAEPAMPVEDRAADTWEPLVAVADHAGSHWPERARAAVLALTAEADDNGETSTRVRLLADCRTAFGTDPALPTAVLLERLKTDAEAPWADYGPTGLTAMRLGVILREYGIRSANIRFPDGSQVKGYQRADFADAWARYCPPPSTLDTPKGSEIPLFEGVAVPAVPASSSQVSAGRLPTVGRLSRPSKTSRPSLTSTNEAGTAGTATPPELVYPRSQDSQNTVHR